MVVAENFTLIDGDRAVPVRASIDGDAVRVHFLDRLSRPQVSAMGENCRRISVALKTGAPTAKIGRV